MKILHLATDDRFIDYAGLLFEKAFPNSNDIYIFSRSKKLKYVKLAVNKIVKPNKLLKRPLLKPNDYAEYDVVIFHSLSGLLYSEIFAIPNDIPTIWFGWGYDYYGLITSEESLLLEKTQRLTKKIKKKALRTFIADTIRTVLEKLKVNKRKSEALKKIDLFSPVLPQEYIMVKNSRPWHQFPEYIQWNYGTIEDNFIKGFEGAQIESNSILLGNSASSTSNHIEAFYLLKKMNISDRDIISPLSYGSLSYRLEAERVGKDLFQGRFLPLKDFLPIEEYVKIIKQCGYVIMNHKRQQAIGNIVIMLYLGARVFLREENPAYDFFKGMGVTLSSIQELEDNSWLIDTPLSSKEKEVNRRLVNNYWSRKKGIQRTKNIVECALQMKRRNFI